MVDLIEGAPELAVNGATPEQLGRALAADSALTRIAGASARTAGIGQGLTSLCCGPCDVGRARWSASRRSTQGAWTACCSPGSR